ncbi:hypothetical protein [uncultured Phenylobacterium sp.]|uniref:hypothetical protein n=1 Tax=uncultured Phenylobacterium sp. TaxID=349273 RepID=UPI0025CBA01B|nr:hypothetical protein [uncultured Phenylobacterium sp.]
MRLAIITLAATTLAIVGGAAAIAAKEPKPSPLGPPPPAGTGLPSGQCIRSDDIRNHTIADRSTMLLAVERNKTYRVTVDSACLGGATSSDPIITRQPPGSRIICKPIDLDLAVSKGGFPSQCIVRSIVLMTPAEVAALPRKLKP